jgi:hypothetical protein
MYVIFFCLLAQRARPRAAADSMIYSEQRQVATTISNRGASPAVEHSREWL